MGAGAQPPLGTRLRRRRSDTGLSLTELARRLDVSPSLVSQIETGRVNPSVRTLYAMVRELGVSLDDIFAPAPVMSSTRIHSNSPARPVQRSGTRRSLELETGVRWERLTARTEPGLEFLYVTYPPGSESARRDAPVRHSGTECGIVVSGRLGLTLAENEYILGPGDSVSFDSTTPHRLYAAGNESSRAIWVVIGRSV